MTTDHPEFTQELKLQSFNPVAEEDYRRAIRTLAHYLNRNPHIDTITIRRESDSDNPSTH